MILKSVVVFECRQVLVTGFEEYCLGLDYGIFSLVRLFICSFQEHNPVTQGLTVLHGY